MEKGEKTVFFFTHLLEHVVRYAKDERSGRKRVNDTERGEDCIGGTRVYICK